MKSAQFTDHKHTCSTCGHEWECFEFSLKECMSGGVFNAMKVNKSGPHCNLCHHLIMAMRHAENRGFMLSFKLTKKKGARGKSSSRPKARDLQSA